jgi:hypothetical protein
MKLTEKPPERPSRSPESILYDSQRKEPPFPIGEWPQYKAQSVGVKVEFVGTRHYYLSMTADEILKCLLTLTEDALSAAVAKKRDELPELVRRLVAAGLAGPSDRAVK